MKHVKVFEAFEAEMMTPEEFGQRVDDILKSGSDHLTIAKEISDFFRQTKPLWANKAEYVKKLRGIGPWMDSLTPEQQEEVRSMNREINREKASEPNPAPAKKDYPDITSRRVATIAAKRAKILDRLMAGEITKQEALAAL